MAGTAIHDSKNYTVACIGAHHDYDEDEQHCECITEKWILQELRLLSIQPDEDRAMGRLKDAEITLTEDEVERLADEPCSMSRVTAGQGLRFAVSKLPQLTSLELYSVEMYDVEQRSFRLLHPWRLLR